MSKSHVKTWVYKNEKSEPYGEVRRFDEITLDGQSRKQTIPYFKDGGNSKGLPNDFCKTKRIFGIETVKDKSKPLFITEGEKCAYALQRLGYQSITNLGGCQNGHLADWSIVDGVEEIFLCPDNDEVGVRFIKGLYNRLKLFNSKPIIKILRMPNVKEKGDVCDWLKVLPELSDWNELDSLENHSNREQIKAQFEALYQTSWEAIPVEWKYTVTSNGLRAIELEDFQGIKFPQRRKLLSPWLDERSINMIFADRGCGKTFFALSCATAIANGGSFTKYTADQPVSVMYLDGEMQAPLMQDRFNGLVVGGKTKAPLYVVTPDCQNIDEMPDLGTPKGQKEIDELIYKLKPSVIFIDNLSTFVRSGNENEGESWLPVQSWAVRHRSEGRTIIFVHHTNKEGKQRGSHRREDVMDIVIQLKKPDDYDESQKGACFEVHYTKGRSLYGDDAQPFKATLQEIDGKPLWKHESTDSEYAHAIDLMKDGISITAIAEELGKNKSTVSRWKKRAQSEGLFSQKQELHGFGASTATMQQDQFNNSKG